MIFATGSVARSAFAVPTEEKKQKKHAAAKTAIRARVIPSSFCAYLCAFFFFFYVFLLF
jgi:hypothetical protein